MRMYKQHELVSILAGEDSFAFPDKVTIRFCLNEERTAFVFETSCRDIEANAVVVAAIRAGLAMADVQRGVPREDALRDALDQVRYFFSCMCHDGG